MQADQLPYRLNTYEERTFCKSRSTASSAEGKLCFAGAASIDSSFPWLLGLSLTDGSLWRSEKITDVFSSR